MFGVSVYAEVSNFLFQSKALIGDVKSSFTDADQQELALKQIDCTLGLHERLAKSLQEFSATVDAAVNFGGTKQ
ncbi:MAG: hypothetical protein HC829_03495 [Bacteroidales bacterium]|nr:hypothetical protein [Candidatus Methylacidiphilales bacterium]NJO54014.1 hypothetical protein [Bacteroidales bacterium]